MLFKFGIRSSGHCAASVSLRYQCFDTTKCSQLQRQKCAMFLDISTLKDEIAVQYSRLKLLQLASQIVLPIRATSISLYLNWRRGYLETNAFSMLFGPPTPGSPHLLPPSFLVSIVLRLHQSLACRILSFCHGFWRITLQGLLIRFVCCYIHRQ